MRYSPNGRYIVMERGQHPSDGARRLEVCEAATGAVIGTWTAGFNPRWLSETWIVVEAVNGQPMLDQLEAITVQYIPANRGQLDANGHGVWAVSDLLRTRLNDGRNGEALDAREPRLSARGELAIRHPQTGALRLFGRPDLGPCEDSRWSSETLCWWLGGRVWGRSTPDVPTVELTVPGRACAKACPLWTGSRLFVGLVLDDGELWVAEWHDLVARNGLGWRVGDSSGSGFDWDLRQDGGYLSVAYLDPLGRPVYVDLLLDQPQQSMLKPEPDPDPEPLPDIPWRTDPNGVVEDISAWLFDLNQGPDVHIGLGADGRRVRFFCKSTEGSGDGPGQYIGEHWDEFGDYIGHLEDASTGRRILDGREVIAEDIVRLFPADHARVWAGLKLNRNTFADGRRLWMPRRCVSGTSIRYVTDIAWTVPPRETPHTRVWRNIPVEIRVDVGYGRIKGKDVRVRAAYIPDGNEEVSFYGPPKGYNAWIAGPTRWTADPWSTA